MISQTLCGRPQQMDNAQLDITLYSASIELSLTEVAQMISMFLMSELKYMVSSLREN